MPPRVAALEVRRVRVGPDHAVVLRLGPRLNGHVRLHRQQRRGHARLGGLLLRVGGDVVDDPVPSECNGASSAVVVVVVVVVLERARRRREARSACAY